MPSYYIHMNQGIAADLRNFTLCSGQFASCAPIVFYNANDHTGGLYHLAGCSELKKIRVDHLRMIETVVGPTIIYVLSGTADAVFGIAQGHVEPVKALFTKKDVRTDFNGRSSYSSISVSEKGGALTIEVGCDAAAIKLNTSKSIKAISDDVAFIGEERDEKLAKWL